VFYPPTGSNDLRGSSVYLEEDGCLTLRTSALSAEVAKPSALLFESFGPELQWAYFRLECQPLKLSGVYDNIEEGQIDTEELVLVSLEQLDGKSA